MLKEHTQQLLNISLTDEQVTQFESYSSELQDWNTRINLTAITDPQGIAIRHFLDSLTVVQVIGFDAGDKLIDVGTGAGFPGLPLAILFPQVHVTLMEATGKKLTFIQHVIDTLGLKNAKTLHARAEDAGQDVAHRGMYDVVLARAVARLPVLLEYMLPLAKIGGFCIAMKGATALEEIEDSKRALFILHGDVKPPVTVQLPFVEDDHYLITVEKLEKTPKTYPRKAGLPAKKPIGF